MTLSINLTTRSITGSGMSGVIPTIHRCTPHQNLMRGSLLPTSLKLQVTSSAGELRTAGELTPVGLGEATATAPSCVMAGRSAGDPTPSMSWGTAAASTAQAYSAVPVTVKGLAGAATLVGGDDNGSTGSGYTYCAVLKTSTAVCWGQYVLRGCPGD